MPVHSVEIPLAALARKRLPEICPITGQTEGLTWKKLDFTWHPRWIWLFIVPALLIALVLSLIFTRRATAELAFAKGAHLRWRLGQAVFGLVFVAALVGLVVAIAMFSTRQPTQGGVLLLAAVAAPIAAWLGVLRGKGVVVERITETALVLRIPSEAAAAQYRATVAGESWGVTSAVAQVIDRASQVTREAPQGALCAKHPDTQARWSCGRCGSFFCPLCAKSTAPGANPLCADCFGKVLEQNSSLPALGPGWRRLVWWGVALGTASIIPGCWIGTIASFVVNGLALARGLKADVADRPRIWWVPIASLLVTVGGLLWLFVPLALRK